MKEKIYMIGIGGIGMSALAQMLTSLGYEVSGSDREESPTTTLLKEKGISVSFTQDGTEVPDDASRVIYSEAVWEDNPERMRAKELGIVQESYFEALGKISEGKRTIAVSGTHGKTTTTGMLACILRDADVSPSAIVGSIVKDFGSNYLAGTSDWFVVEACEYKRDFLTLAPDILVVTNIEFDHTDYYKDLADVQDAFRTLMQKARVVVTDTTHPNIAPLLSGLSAKIVNYRDEPDYELQLFGEFNKMNARSASAVAREVLPTISDTTISESLAHFRGTWRRFDYKGKTARGADVYDDYAHHPTAIAKTLAEIRMRTKGKVYVAFHPHLYSRTRDLLDGFSKAFTDADGVFIAPIYPAREVDDGSISSAMLATEITKHGPKAEALSFEEIREAFEKYPEEGDVIVTMGAGDIYKVADAIVV